MKAFKQLAIAAMLANATFSAFAGEAEDQKLAADVKTAIDNVPALKAFTLKIVAKDGNVTIDGAVDEGLQMAEVGMITEKVPGVKFVFNNIMPKN